MSLFNVFDIAGSGMSAQMLRLNTTASNLANAESVSNNKNDTYRSKHPIFATIKNDFGSLSGNDSNAGVKVTEIVESSAPLKQRYLPDHPMANEEGYVFMPNVNPVEEMANMISASRAYQSNVEIMNTSKQMLLGTLRLGE